MKHPDQCLNRCDERPDTWLYIDELMHRTLNDYTSILMTVQQASANISDRKISGSLNAAAFQLRASAASLRALAPPRGDATRCLDLDLETLCEALSKSLLTDRRISISLVSEPIIVDAFRCWQISLIVAELITNAARHAFKFGSGECVMLELRKRHGNIHCIVTDDGASNVVISPGRGSAIVDALATQLGGSVVRNFASKGSTIILCVPA